MIPSIFGYLASSAAVAFWAVAGSQSDTDGGTGRAAGEDDVTAALERLGHPLGPDRASMGVVPFHDAQVVDARLSPRVAVDRHDLDARSGRLLHRGELGLAEVGVDDDRVRTLRDRGADVRDHLLEIAATGQDDLLDVLALRSLGANRGK